MDPKMIKNVLVASGLVGRVSGIELKATSRVSMFGDHRALNLLSVVTIITWSSQFPENFSLLSWSPEIFPIFIENRKFINLNVGNEKNEKRGHDNVGHTDVRPVSSYAHKINRFHRD